MVDFDQQLIGLYQVPLIDIDLGNIAVHARENVHELVWNQIGGIGQPYVEIPPDGETSCPR